jgi:hypothetical protein
MAFNQIRKAFIVLVGFFLSIASVIGQEIIVKKEHGITVVYNPREPIAHIGQSPALTLEEDLSIKSVPNKENHTFFQISAVRADDEGNIYILDPRAGAIIVFNKSGEYIRNVGRQGQGPGELEMPVGLQLLTSAKSLAVASFGKLSYFSLSGEFQKQIINPIQDPVPRIDSNGNIVARRTVFLESKVKEELVKFDANMRQLLEVAQIELEGPHSGKKRNPFPKGVFFSVMNDDGIVWGINTDYVLTLIDPKGKTKMKIVKTYKPIKITDEEKLKMVEERSGGKGNLSQYQFPDYYPPFLDIQSDDTGKIIVGTYEFDQEGHRYYDIFDKAGRYIDKFAFPGAPSFIKNNLLYCIKEDKDGNQAVIRFRMKWQ